MHIDPIMGSIYNRFHEGDCKANIEGIWTHSEYMNSQSALEAWHAETLKANWQSPQEIKAQFRSASILKNNRVVFIMAGNKYRLIVAIDYQRQVCFVKFIGTHRQYDQIDAETV